LYWKDVSNGIIPTCVKCSGVCRPDVVFFGESLPTRFLDMRKKDLAECDLLIIIGTSLVVYPFAGLVNEVKAEVPRLLINKESVGPFQKNYRRRNVSL